jgi:2-octaprenyl-6-methoxyphenol hydroxylase
MRAPAGVSIVAPLTVPPRLPRPNSIAREWEDSATSYWRVLASRAERRYDRDEEQGVTKQRFSADVAVVGGGPSGLVAALALAGAGIDILLVAPKPPHPDRRTTALLDGSVETLRRLAVWPKIEAQAAALKFLRLIDATQRILRAPEVLFDSAELGLEAFGYNVENETLREALFETCRQSAKIRIVESSVSVVEPDSDGVDLTIGGEKERVLLVAASDGRKSICRAAAGISTRSRALPQTAIVLNLTHSEPHNDTSTEFHTESGPFTFAPLLGKRSSLVCVVRPEEAETIRAMDDAALALEVERRAHSILGKMEAKSARGIFPLGTEIAERFAANRIALIGEAAHVLPPIGAQGLNLGIRDAVQLAEQVANSSGRDPGSDEVLREYDSSRGADVRGRAMFVDFANRSLMSDFLPLHAARGLGLQLANRVGFVRRALMRQGLGPANSDRHFARGDLP